MPLMEEPIAARGAYFVFLYILVTVTERIVAGYYGNTGCGGY